MGGFTLIKAEDSGYIVFAAGFGDHRGEFRPPLCAGPLDHCLAYLRSRVIKARR